MAIRHWPQTEQPRFKLLNNGPHSLSDAELIAIFLGSGYSGHSACGHGQGHAGQGTGTAPVAGTGPQDADENQGTG